MAANQPAAAPAALSDCACTQACVYLYAWTGRLRLEGVHVAQQTRGGCVSALPESGFIRQAAAAASGAVFAGWAK